MGIFAPIANETGPSAAFAHAILIALGANLPGADGSSPMDNCVRALDMMPVHGIEILRRSRWFSSAPVPACDQPEYVNGIVQVATALGPDALLAALHGIEDALGRVRSHANAARVIDLDLIAHGRNRREANGGLILPHPRLHERAFVLLPMADLVPDWRHPGSGKTLVAMIADLPAGQCCTPLG